MFTLSYNVNSKVHRVREKKEVDAFFSWFMSVLPGCLEELIASVKETEGFADWQTDYTPGSLLRLGDWYETQIKTRPYTSEEMEYMKHIMRFDEDRPIEFDPWTLTSDTLATSVKMGMYYGEVFRRRLPFMEWKPCKLGNGKSKKPNVDYGQPVLDGPKVIHLNPVSVCQSVAFGIARGHKSGQYLHEVFENNVKLRENMHNK
ncbi:hypothetical protein ELI24_39045 [Rhizobium ruizarguesonis]|uniref:hypothetical protein n=1 Tax=Rhizobium ruizarguesonis TaxID=2081791 RepID=UPI001030881F|nr:hypothetical protein [Rhizobium ruizarguesonis]TAU12970.1 hypothetical protein ELI48_38540 [Rhizobium ruizarguesonis]TAU56926.1 hypothetical protein ELI45_38760 [Rhizobium ruizarguesonis]TAV01699.1 hypothetical protein ELI34_38660 [Rhizobium ruizarguesonis]TAV18730.1 hypothetical protein ELI35_39075 [Rhizobium ruizarguesonis]TAV83096.1 hypothetical protein ELI24_39045 [Rhizobium ruizarguesonis]